MSTYLKEACSIISEQGFSNEYDDGEIQHPFLFVSDRGKGLKLALQSVQEIRKRAVQNILKQAIARSSVKNILIRDANRKSVLIQILKSLD
jgi:hypothetical protein